MKKLIVIVIVGMLMSSCSRYVNAGGGGCGVWYEKKFKPNPKSWRIVSPRVQPRPRMVSM